MLPSSLEIMNVPLYIQSVIKDYAKGDKSKDIPFWCDDEWILLPDHLVLCDIFLCDKPLPFGFIKNAHFYLFAEMGNVQRIIHFG